MNNVLELYDIVNSSSEEAVDYRYKGIDYIVRVKNDAETGKYIIVVAETVTITYTLNKIISENYILKTIIKNQWQSYNYCWEYNKFLLGNVTNEEFLIIARWYARHFDKLRDEQILELTSIIFNIIGGTLNSGEISQLINVDPTDIERVLNKYSHNKVVELSED
jgi:hypothetical protein